MARQTHEHRHTKTDSEVTDLPTVLYGCEMWTMNDKEDGKKINSCEMWIWRKMQRISWMEKKITNESVLIKI